MKKLTEQEKLFIDDLSTLMRAYGVHLAENEQYGQVDYTFLSTKDPPRINLTLRDLGVELSKKRQKA